MANKNVLLLVVIAAVLVSILYLEYTSTVVAPSEIKKTSLAASDGSARVLEKAAKYPPAIELADIQGYINTDEFSENREFSIASFIGKKVILVDFWTYTCINCQRTLPYLTAWDEKYRDDGLLIIGIHTPEFEFEKKKENVEDAVKQFGIRYPVVQDNNYATWHAYQNRYWPHKYLIDIDGFIVYDHIGEGAYEETERKIQELLKERMELLGMKEELDTTLADVPSYSTASRSPETYFGAWRNTNFYGENGKEGVQELVLPEQIKPNILYLSGKWDIQQQYAEAASENASITFLYGAKNVFLVMRSDNLEPVKLSVLVDGEEASADLAGSDVADGAVSVKEDRLYKIIEGDSYGEHVLTLTAENPGLQAFAFTFG